MGASTLLLLGTFLPAAFADTGGISASPSVAPPNTTISLMSSATITGATAAGYYDSIFFIAVLTPSGFIYGCIGGSSTCGQLDFTSSSSGGTYQCKVPFGGSVATDSLSTTGGVSNYIGCPESGADDSTAWTGISSNLCSGTSGIYTNICSGASGFADLVSTCSNANVGGFIGFGDGSLSPSNGDTSQTGTYSIIVCWNFVTVVNEVVIGSQVPSTGTFQISPSSGVPEFPLGTLALLAIALPVLVLVRAKFSASRKSVASV